MQNRTQADSGSVERLLGIAEERLREFGIALAPDPDGGMDTVVLSRGDITAVYTAQVKASMTLTSVAGGIRAGSHPLLVIGERISRRSADAFREAKIQFVDTLGNAFVAFGGVFVDVRGRAEPADQPRANPSPSGAKKSTNLFSRGRAQVILALLTWPELVGARRRDIAHVAGTSLGQAQDALTRLDEAGFLPPASPDLIRFDELFDLWAAAYPTGLGQRLEVARFHGDPSRPIESVHPVYLSGETAEGVDIARPATRTAYLDSVDPKLAIANRWSTNPDRVRNIFIRHKFWTSPRPAEEDSVTKARNAPWPLVYADLMATGDARLAGVARTWRADHARRDRG